MNQRIVANKHVNREMDVNASMFKNLGQVIISNEPDHEGIFIINSNNEVIEVATNMLSGSTVVDESVKRWLRENYLSSGNTVEYVEGVKAELNERIDGVDERVDGLVLRINGVDYRLDDLEERVHVLEVSGSTGPIDEDTVRRIADEEIAKIITSAGTIMVSDHVFLTRDQYDVLLASGSTIIDGKYVVYSDKIYYCIYEGELPPPTSGGTEVVIDEGTGTAILVGDYYIDEDTETVIVEDVHIDGDTVIFEE